MPRHVLSQRLIILPLGRILGGHLNYTLSPELGNVHYQGEIRLQRRWWWRPSVIRFCGQQRLNPLILPSAHVKVGQTYYYRRVRVQVRSIENGIALAHVYYDGAYPGEGSALFDLRGEYVKLKSVGGDGKLRHRSIFGSDHVNLQLIEGINGDQDL